MCNEIDGNFEWKDRIRKDIFGGKKRGVLLWIQKWGWPKAAIITKGASW